jgi:hypothetical protein
MALDYNYPYSSPSNQEFSDIISGSFTDPAVAAALAQTSTPWLGGLTGEVARTLTSQFTDRPYSLRAFGAKCDYRKFMSGGSLPNGSSRVTGNFATASLGMMIYITGSGVYQSGTITNLVSATQVDVSFAATQAYSNAEYGFGTDDTAAVKRCIDICAKNAVSTTNDGGIPILVPGATLVTDAVLSYRPGNAGIWGPITWIGNGWKASGFMLWPLTAVETWLYDSNAAQAYYLHTFRDMSMTGVGPNKAFASLFRLKSAGQDQEFHFHNVYLAGDSCLRGFVYNGTGNADKFNFSQSVFKNFQGTIHTLNNSQSVCHQFHGCQFEGFKGNVFDILDGTDGNGGGGGGHVLVSGGSFVYGDGPAKQWLLTAAGSNNLNSRFTFVGIRCENHGTDNAGLVMKTGALGAFQINFTSSNFGTDTNVNAFEAVRIDVSTDVTFYDCVISSRMTYRFLNTTGSAHTLASPGAVIFENCRVPDALETKATFDNVYGIFVSSNPRPQVLGRTARIAVALAFDTHHRNCGTTARDVKIKRVAFKPVLLNWPFSNGGGAGGVSLAATDMQLTLPQNAILVGFKVFKPATGADTNAYQLSVGTNDKATAWASSTLAQYKDAHVINTAWDASQWIYCGTDPNKLTLRLWAPSGGSNTVAQSNLANESCWAEYI